MFIYLGTVGAFDRISWLQLFKKLILFGAGVTYISCLMAIYHRSEYIVFGNNENISYEIGCRIKQGSPMSPMPFLFYVDNILIFFHYFRVIMHLRNHTCIDAYGWPNTYSVSNRPFESSYRYLGKRLKVGPLLP